MTAHVAASIADTAHSTHPHSSRLARGRLVFVLTAACCLAVPMRAPGQVQTQQPANTTETTAQKPAPVTTTVVVHGEVKDDYLTSAVTAGNLDGTLLKETPLSVTAVSRAVLNDQMARVLSDVVRNDASVGEDYAPVGYYGDFQIRGFPIDLATGLQINGMTISGNQDVPLENKESRPGKRRGIRRWRD
jgi:iron complex outermembrane receptor protein